MKRICIVGTTGSGKTWLASKLATKCDLRVIDLDDLHWNPGWQASSTDVFRERIIAAEQFAEKTGHGWVMAGNYGGVADLTRAKAEMIIWLDYSPCAVLPGLLRRQLAHIRARTTHCNGNIETWRQSLSRNSLIIWFFKTAFDSSARFLPLYTDPKTAGKAVVRLRSRRETSRFLRSFED